MNTTIQTLDDICQRHPFQGKILFVPSYSVGHQIGEHLARMGSPWINLRWTTTSGYALGLISPDLSSESVRLINEQERLMIIEQLIREREIPLQYFKKASDTPGMISSLAKAIHELRMAGLAPGTLNPEAFIVKEKGDELHWLLGAYDQNLQENHLVDHAALLGMAIQHLEENRQIQDDTVFMVLSDFPLAELEKRLIRLAGRDALLVIDHPQPAGLHNPKRLFPTAEKEDSVGPAPCSDVDLLRWMYDPQHAPQPFADGTVSLVHALGESNEVRQTLRRILSDGMPFDDVEIVVTKTDPYFPLIYEICASLGVPLTFAGGLPITYTLPGRALLLYLQWIALDFQEKYLRQMLSDGLLDLEQLLCEEEKPSDARAAALLREAAVGWGQERYLPRLQALAESYRQSADQARGEGQGYQADEKTKRAGQTIWLEHAIAGLFRIIPEVDAKGKISMQELCRAVRDFLGRYGHVAGELDRAAKQKMIDLLDSFTHGLPLSLPRQEAVGRLQAAIASLTAGHSNPRPGHLHVAHYRSGGVCGRTHLFVLGLEQNAFPGALLQDPVVLDVERERLGESLIRASERIHENVYMLARLLAAHAGKVTLSYPCRDLVEERDRFPASLVLGAFRVMSGDHQADYSKLKEHLGAPAGFLPADAAVPLNDWEWWLSQQDRLCGIEAVHASYPGLGKGCLAQAEREKDVLGVYDGWIVSLAKTWDPYAEKKTFSCSGLEELARCPFRFFLHHVLRIEPPRDMQKDPGKWLDPLQRGQLYHEIFYRFMTLLRERHELPPAMLHHGLLRSIALGEIDRVKTQIPPSGDLVFRREVQDILDSLSVFLQEEEQHCREVEPVFFELAFGLEGGEPVLVSVGTAGRFKLRGRIDRIDYCGEHSYEVWDYKTGSPSSMKEHLYTAGGTQLQHALYAVAAETLLRKGHDPKARVKLGGYFFPTLRGDGHRIQKRLDREQLCAVLAPLFGLLANGVFPQTHEDDQCRWCDYPAVCGEHVQAWERYQEKLKTDGKLAPWRELKEDETS